MCSYALNDYENCVNLERFGSVLISSDILVGFGFCMKNESLQKVVLSVIIDCAALLLISCRPNLEGSLYLEIDR